VECSFYAIAAPPRFYTTKTLSGQFGLFDPGLT
jgi:hypothetical protein